MATYRCRSRAPERRKTNTHLDVVAAATRFCETNSVSTQLRPGGWQESGVPARWRQATAPGDKPRPHPSTDGDAAPDLPVRGLGGSVQLVATAIVPGAVYALRESAEFLKRLFALRSTQLAPLAFVSIDKQQILHVRQASLPVPPGSRPEGSFSTFGTLFSALQASAVRNRPAPGFRVLWHSRGF
jgi:hypothetical protein